MWGNRSLPDGGFMESWLTSSSCGFREGLVFFYAKKCPMAVLREYVTMGTEKIGRIVVTSIRECGMTDTWTDKNKNTVMM